ncbi:hypothetical protein PHISCL_10895, partial [Aspergillus sclerotialis]
TKSLPPDSARRTKSYTSPIVWVVLKREVSLVPEPKLILSVTVGFDSSTSLVGGAAEAGAGAGAVVSEVKLPGIEGTPGVGLPRR